MVVCEDGGWQQLLESNFLEDRADAARAIFPASVKVVNSASVDDAAMVGWSLLW
jgi:hypothetical protein